MKKQIIIAPGINESELLKSFSMHGVNTIGLRTMSTTEAAEYALEEAMQYDDRKKISPVETLRILKDFCVDFDYFHNLGYTDRKNLMRAITTVRSQIAENEDKAIDALKNGEFKEKNEALAGVIKKYKTYLNDSGMEDPASRIRFAAKNGSLRNVKLLTLKEFELNALDEYFLEQTSLGQYERISLADMFPDKSEKTNEFSVWSCYGKREEANAVISYIYENDIPLDSCVIAVSDQKQYSQLFYDLKELHEIPISLGCGYPISNTNPAKLLKLLISWEKEGYHGMEYLKSIMTSPCFDKQKMKESLEIDPETSGTREFMRMIETAGALRLTADNADNNKKLQNMQETGIPAENMRRMELLARELELGYGAFVRKYSVLRENSADYEAALLIDETLREYADSKEDLEEVIADLMNRNVGREKSHPGQIYVTDIRKALSTTRDILFVCGLNASVFPGTAKEDYLLLDSDLKLINSNNPPTSVRILEEKKETLKNLIRLNKRCGNPVILTYPSYNTADLKEENASSVLYELYKEECPEGNMDDYNARIVEKGYFDDATTSYGEYGKEYIAGKEILRADVLPAEVGIPELLNRRFSPTAIDVFFSCQKRFYLTKILGIQEIEDIRPFEVIRANDLGTLVHRMMEEKANSGISEEDFMALASREFDKFIALHTPLNADKIEPEKNRYLKMMQNGYEQDPSNRVIGSEEKYEALHESGIWLQGTPDRVEIDHEGNAIIADYKTYNSLQNIEDDYETCRQVIIYAYIMEKNGIPINRCEYRYLRSGTIVSTYYNDAKKAKLEEEMNVLKTAIIENKYECTTKKDNCKYCTLSQICGKGTKQENVDNE